MRKRVVWKYRLGLGVQEVSLPSSAVIVQVREQGDDLMMWALVDPGERVSLRTVHVVMTGELFDCQERYQHVGTALMQGGLFVVHVFEVRS